MGLNVITDSSNKENDFLYRIKRAVLEPYYVPKSRRKDHDRIRLYATFTGDTKLRKDGKTWFLLRDVYLPNGVFVADHLWIPKPKYGEYKPMAGQRCTFTGFVYRYDKYVGTRDYPVYQYGVEDVKKLEVMIQ